jgi:hypothetical protein
MWTCRNCPLAVSLLTLLIVRVHTDFCEFIRQRAPLVRCRLSMFIVERHLSVDGAPVKSNIWKSRYQPNVQLRMLYLTNETGQLKLFKRPSYLSLNATFSSFSIPLHIGTGNGNDTGGIFLSGLVFLITGWMEHIMRPTRSYSVQNSGRDSRTRRTDIHTDIRTETTVAIRRFIHEWICVNTLRQLRSTQSVSENK